MKLNKKMLGLITAGVLFVGVACGTEEDTTQVVEDSNAKVEEQSENAKDTAKKEEKETDIPMEYKQALKSAENYIDMMAFSKEGLYDQLTSEYADQFTEEAAKYAIENLDVDWKEEAVESAENYLDTMSFSKDGLYDQLTSEYGDQFTEEEAQYAVDKVYK